MHTSSYGIGAHILAASGSEPQRANYLINPKISYATFPRFVHSHHTLFTSRPGTPSGGSVTLRSSNLLDSPRVDLGFLTHPFDILALTEAIRATKRFLNSSAWTNDGYITGFLGPDPDILPKGEFEERLKAISNPYWHVVGTAALGRVVNGELKVKGTKGLRVVDASVIVSTIFVKNIQV